MPAMTREERNKRRADLRFQTQHARYTSLLHTTIGAFNRLHKEHRALDWLLNYRKEWIHPYRKGLGYYVHQLDGVWDTMWALMYRKLVFCYPHPDTGVWTDSKVLCDAGLASRLSVSGDHCHVTHPNPELTVYVPISDKGVS